MRAMTTVLSRLVLQLLPQVPPERKFFIDNLLLRIRPIIVMIRWTGLATREFEFSFSDSLTSTFL